MPSNANNKSNKRPRRGRGSMAEGATEAKEANAGSVKRKGNRAGSPTGRKRARRGESEAREWKSVAELPAASELLSCGRIN